MYRKTTTLRTKFPLLWVLLMPVLATGAAEHYKRLRSFSGPDGSKPYAKLTLASDGAFYGTTSAGGANNHGTLFKLTSDEQYTVIWNFGALPTDASSPWSEVVEGGDGALYGTTVSGGSSTNGTVFKVNKDGSNFNILYSFPTGSPRPYAGLTDDKAGALYGTTSRYGPPFDNIYSLNQDGTGFRILYDQIPCNHEDFWPEAPLIIGTDGGLYGTGNGGGADSFHGMIFRLDRDTGTFTVLYSFPGQFTNYVGLKSALMEASDGLLYGTIRDEGILFRIAKDGSNYAIIHRFGDQHDTSPGGQLVAGADESLYGVTGVRWGTGGGGGWDTIFKINKDGTGHTVLHRFGVAPDGSSPGSGLARGFDGAFYGTTVLGGDSGQGTIYKLWPPQTPDVAVSNTNGTVQVTVTGRSGYNYELLTSANLTNWSPLSNFVMPSSDTYVHTETNAPPEARFYRAAWLP